MHAIEIRRHGGPEVLEYVERPLPTPGPGEVLVRNVWVGVNYVDLQHREGAPYPVELPLVPGTEAAGVVAAVGDGVDGALVGRRVVHLGHLAGVYAEYTAVPLEFVVEVPADVGLDVAAAVGMAGSTAHVLGRIATQVAGRTIVVHAAGGSTGGALVRVARADGAHVIGIASSQAKAYAAAALGAHEVVAADETPDLAAVVRDLTGGRGADLVFDATGRATWEASLRMLATGGTLVVYGAASGQPDLLEIARLSGLTGEPGISGSLGVRWVAAGHYLAGAARADVVQAVLADVAAGLLSARIEQRFALRDAAAAHELLGGRTVTGKLLLAVSEE